MIAVAYVLVGIGVFVGRRDAHDGWLKALAAALLWPVLALIGLGRHIA